MNKQSKRIMALILALSLVFTFSALAVDGNITASALKVRSGTSTESEILGKYLNGETIDVQGRVGDWYMVEYNGEMAFVFSEYVDMGDIEVKNSMGTITGSSVNVRSGPGTDNKVLGKLMDGTMVTLTGIENGWYKIKFLELEGYVHPDYLEVDGLVFTYVKTDENGKTTESYSNADTETASTASKLIEYAMQYLGVPYVYGGTTTDGFDCSGFTQYVFAAYGYTLKRSSADQYNNNGTAVSKDELIPGDLVFFSRSNAAVGHVGIYIGDDYFIHASSTGDVVRITALSSSYYVEHYVGARRIIEE